MKKFLNDPANVVTEGLRGFGRAHRELVTVHNGPLFVTRATPKSPKVALVSGGGSGHEPLHAGFLGHGMLDAACPGQVFTSPTPDQIVAATTAVDTGHGTLFIIKNYEGDIMNFEMAAETLPGQSASLLVQDDVAVESSTYSTSRRGVAGTLVVEKIVGAAAEAGADLPACIDLGNRVARACPSMGVALSSSTVQQLHGASHSEAQPTVQLHGASHSEAHVRARAAGDGNGRRHPRRAGTPARSPEERR
jgi:dihydroxyacetone kinase-like protein